MNRARSRQRSGSPSTISAPHCSRSISHSSPTVLYPTLVSVGYTTVGEEWLIDLEQCGALIVDGDPDRCLDLARFIAAELAHNVWSDHLTVTVAGQLDAELVELN